MGTMGAHGQGGVTKRADGRLQVSITLTSGKRVYRTIPKFTDPKRQAKLAEAARRELVAMREAEIDPTGQTLEDFLRSWLRRMADAQRLRPNTLGFYRIMAEKHVIKSPLGPMPIDRIRVAHVQAWLDSLTMSAQYVSHCRAFLRRVLNVALAQRLIAYNPAARGIELPKIAKYRAATMSKAEIKALFAATANDRLGALWRVAAMTGLRSGEIAALSWDDVDLAAGKVRVVATLGRANGEYVRAEPKADRSLERMHIDPETVRMLETHRIRQAAERTADWPYWGLVFTTPAGMPMDRATMLAAFHEACDRAGIARRRVHDIRHSNNSWMRDAGIGKDARKARHGHSTDAMDERYGEPSSEQDRIAVEQLAEALA